MQAITTKNLPATATLGARVKATTASGISATVSRDYGLDDLDNARAAVDNLVHGHLNAGWRGTYYSAATANGYVFVRDDNPTTLI